MAFTAIMTGMSLKLQIVPYANALNRTSSLFAVLFGAVFFHERYSLRRGIGALLMLIGVGVFAGL